MASHEYYVAGFGDAPTDRLGPDAGVFSKDQDEEESNPSSSVSPDGFDVTWKALNAMDEETLKASKALDALDEAEREEAGYL
ncbi:MAG: hypothetical protein OXC07_05625 [Kistimonas sp.]|nr:hypothetical protein [Kistimonas sp.]